jgi:hypothetical protein
MSAFREWLERHLDFWVPAAATMTFFALKLALGF